MPGTYLRHVVSLMFLALSFFLAPSVLGQIVIHGTVVDASTRETLPSANIQIEGAYQGTITNADGDFSIEVESMPAVLIVRYIGYASQRVEVTESPREPVRIALEPTVYLLEGIEVTDENPAIAIMRKVIERKKIWRAALQSYEAEAYNRFTLKNDTGIVSIIESFTETYWNPEDGTREVVKARRQTNNLTFNEFLPAAQFVANLYDDNLDIAGYDFVGVTHPDALKHYAYELIGYRQMDDRLVYDISVEPKNKFKTAFTGRVSVLDEEYALIEVELRPGEAFLFPPPVKEFEVTYEQQFSNYGGDAWLPVDFHSKIELKVGLNLLLTFPTFYIDQVSRLSNYEVNVAAPPDSLFEDGRHVVVDSVAVQDEAWLEREGVAVPLVKAEAQAYQTIDSTMTLAKAYKPKGAFARFVDIEAESSDSSNSVRAGAGGGSGWMNRFDLLPQVRFNRVEGGYGELGLEARVSEFLKLRALGGISTELSGGDRFSYGFGGGLRFQELSRLSLDVDYAMYNDTQWNSTPFLRLFNSAVVLLAGRDYYDYFRNERFQAVLGFKPGWRWDIDLGIQLEEHKSLIKTTDYDLLADDRIQRINPTIDEGFVRSVRAGLQYGMSDDNSGLGGRKVIRLDVEHSDPGLIETDFDFTTYRAELEWRFTTLFKRRLFPSTLDLKLIGQTSAGLPPVQRLGVLDGRMGVYNRFGAFKTTDGVAVRGRQFVGLFWEHNFRTFFFEALGAYRLARLGYNVIVFGGHAYSENNLAGLSSALYSDNWRHEIGASLSGVLSVLRIDFAARLDRPGFSIGLGLARIF